MLLVVLMPVASAFTTPAPAGAGARARSRMSLRAHQPRMGLLDDIRAANAERMAINEGKNLVGKKHGVKPMQAFPCQVLKEGWKADKLSSMLQVANQCVSCHTSCGFRVWEPANWGWPA